LSLKGTYEGERKKYLNRFRPQILSDVGPLGVVGTKAPQSRCKGNERIIPNGGLKGLKISLSIPWWAPMF